MALTDPLISERAPAVLFPFCRSSRISQWISSCAFWVPFKTAVFFSLSPRVCASALRALSNYPPVFKLLCQEWGSHGSCVSVFPAHFYVVLLRAVVVQSAYSLFQEELLYMWVWIWCSMGGELRVFLKHHLVPLQSHFWVS